MEQKKQLLIKVLEKLKPYWDLAEGILALIESTYADEKLFDWIIHVINTSIKTVKNKTNRQKMQKWLEKIQEIKAMEDAEKSWERDVEELLADI